MMVLVMPPVVYVRLHRLPAMQMPLKGVPTIPDTQHWVDGL